MAVFLVRRTIQAIVTIVVATFVLFAAITVLPGDPIRALFGFQRPDPETYNQLVAQFHFDEPFLVQYWLFMKGLVTGNLGFTFPRNAFTVSEVGPPIAQVLLASIPVSLVVVAGVIAFQLVLSPLIVLVSGLRPRSLSDRFIHGGSVLLVSIPALVAAFVIQALLGRWNHVLFPEWSGEQGWENYIMPILALGLGAAAHLALVAREELLIVMARPYTKTVEAFGLSRWRIVSRHALKPSLGSSIDLFGANLAILITGLIVVEGVFDVPGIGGTLLGAIQTQDRVFIVTVLTLVLMAVIVINALTDIAHAVVDPRVRDSILTD